MRISVVFRGAAVVGTALLLGCSQPSQPEQLVEEVEQITVPTSESSDPAPEREPVPTIEVTGTDTVFENDPQPDQPRGDIVSNDPSRRTTISFRSSGDPAGAPDNSDTGEGGDTEDDSIGETGIGTPLNASDLCEPDPEIGFQGNTISGVWTGQLDCRFDTTLLRDDVRKRSLPSQQSGESGCQGWWEPRPAWFEPNQPTYSSARSIPCHIQGVHWLYDQGLSPFYRLPWPPKGATRTFASRDTALRPITFTVTNVEDSFSGNFNRIRLEYEGYEFARDGRLLSEVTGFDDRIYQQSGAENAQVCSVSEATFTVYDPNGAQLSWSETVRCGGDITVWEP